MDDQDFIFHFGYVLGAIRRSDVRRYFKDRGVAAGTLDKFEEAASVMSQAFYREPSGGGK
jgi:hypothetical protein